MHAVGAARKRHVQAIVDDDARGGAPDGLAAPADDRGERATVEATLTHLNEMRAGARRRRDARQPGPGGVHGRQLAVRDHADHRTHRLIPRRRVTGEWTGCAAPERAAPEAANEAP